MKSGKKTNQSGVPAHRRTYKTREDFLRWRRQQIALKKQAGHKNAPAVSPQAEALMALMTWVDDGGST